MERQAEVLSFLKQLFFFGSIWFLCLPLLVLCAIFLPPYRRHQFVAGGSIFVQFVALSLLSTLFLESSEYYRVSSLAHMGQALPQSLGAFSGRSHIGGKVAVD